MEYALYLGRQATQNLRHTGRIVEKPFDWFLTHFRWNEIFSLSVIMLMTCETKMNIFRLVLFAEMHLQLWFIVYHWVCCVPLQWAGCQGEEEKKPCKMIWVVRRFKFQMTNLVESVYLSRRSLEAIESHHITLAFYMRSVHISAANVYTSTKRIITMQVKLALLITSYNYKTFDIAMVISVWVCGFLFVAGKCAQSAICFHFLRLEFRLFACTAHVHAYINACHFKLLA